MQASLAGRRPARSVYRRTGRPCPRCGTAILSRGQGDDNRIAYWCPGCQRGEGGAGP
jgi:endonuclease-8